VRLGFFKNLQRKYGPHVLVEAFATIAAECPRTRLTLAGAGEMADALRTRVAQLGLSDKTEFPGRLPHDRMPAAVRAMDVVLMPSVCQESFGVAAIEASACEVPVVASRVGGVGEAVVDRVTGLLVPPGDPDALAGACIGLIRDPQRRRQLGRAGRRFVLDNYQWRQNAATMAAVYGQLLAGRPVRTPNVKLA
jgi:glycosyltransferase involved in cell wall biosynthesis